MTDRAMQALYLLALDPVAETNGDPNSYGFRSQRSTADAIEACFTDLSKKNQAQWILEGDIKSCFDRISHDWLLENVPMDKTMLRKWLKAGFMEKGVLHPTNEGTPQGGIISPVLANTALDGLERELRVTFPAGKRAGRTPKVNLVRYADDFIVTGSTKELLENEVLPLIKNFLTKRGLDLSPDKTRITHIEDGFDFLGQNVRKYKGKLIIKPSKKNIKATIKKIRIEIKVNRAATAGSLITRLNPIIRGWANFHQHICSKDTYNYMDCVIFKMLWQWAKRRHPNKGARWVKEKYFASIRNRNWVFTGEIEEKGKSHKIYLRNASYTEIRRHVKIKGDANPYDPTWESYFEHRIGLKVANNLRGRVILLNLWKSQNGICPVCNTKITEITGWHSHHIVWKSKGGNDTLANQVLLHPNCHNQVHNQKLTVVKPRPARGVTEA